MAVSELHQIPQIALEIAEHRDGVVIVARGQADPVDPGGGRTSRPRPAQSCAKANIAGGRYGNTNVYGCDTGKEHLG